jgi:predicted metal-binding membrane protein
VTSPSTAATAAALTATLGVAAASWVIALSQMDGMNMGVATELGSFASFVALWVSMMAAMMLPGAVPAVSSFIRSDGRVRCGTTVRGVVSRRLDYGRPRRFYALYEPHGTGIAGSLILAAGVYELTPLKRGCRRRCRESVRSGFEFGIYCVGSSIGLMVMLPALGVMSIAWMCVVAALILAQKLLPPRALIDAPLALTIIALGVLVVAAPSSIPNLTPTI